MELTKEELEKIVDKAIQLFKTNLECFKKEIIEIIFKQQEKMNTELKRHGEKLDKHDKILENHLVSITEMKKEIIEIKELYPEYRPFSNKMKWFVIGGILYAITNLGILVFLVHRITSK